MGRAHLLTIVDQRHTLLEELEGRPGHKLLRVGDQLMGTGLVVIFQETELEIVVRIGGVLVGNSGSILGKGNLSGEALDKIVISVVIVSRVIGLVQLGIGVGSHAHAPDVGDKATVHGLAQPEAAGPDGFHFLPGLQPEFHRHQGRNITAEAVHDFRPLL